MPQTRFVLKKALEFGHAVVVVVNKIDRPSARPDYVINSTFELFIELNASDEQVRLQYLKIMGNDLIPMLERIRYSGSEVTRQQPIY